MDHTEAIMEIKKVLDKKFIEEIIYYTKCKCKKNLEIEASLNKKIRNVKGYHLNLDIPIDDFYWNYIKKEIERVFAFYKYKFPKMASSKINQIDLLKYLPGNKYETHIDNFTDSSRHLSIILNLNDNYEGGDLIFTDQKEKEIKRLKLGKGSVVFFPSNFMYPHKIEPITKGTRYSVVAWLQ